MDASQTKLVVEGYIHDVGIEIPTDIISLVLSFMSKLKSWILSKQRVQKMSSYYTIRFNSNYQCRTSLNHEFPFLCYLQHIPSTSKSGGYIQLMVQLISFPKEYERIDIYYELYCDETCSQYKAIKILKGGGNPVGWTPFILPSSKCQQPHIQQLTFSVFIDIIHFKIRYSTQSWYKPLTWHTNHEYEWSLNKQQIRDLKNRYPADKRSVEYFSDLFGSVDGVDNEDNKYWMLSFFFNYSKNYAQLRLRLMRTGEWGKYNLFVRNKGNHVQYEASFSINGTDGNNRSMRMSEVGVLVLNIEFPARSKANAQVIINEKKRNASKIGWDIKHVTDVTCNIKLKFGK